MSANVEEPLVEREAGRSAVWLETHSRTKSLGKRLSARQLGNHFIPFLTLVFAGLGLWIAILSLTRSTLEAYPVPVLGGISLLMQLMFVDVYRQHQKWDFRLVAWTILGFVLMLVLRRLPESFRPDARRLRGRADGHHWNRFDLHDFQQ